MIDVYETRRARAVINTVTQNWEEAKETSPEAFMTLGRADLSQDIQSFQGAVAEFLLFDQALGFLERLQVETYLALKYGISLTEGNYVSASQQVLWHQEENQKYAHRTTDQRGAIPQRLTGLLAGDRPQVEVRDPNDNFVRYHYDKQEDKQQLYVSKITYTGHGQSEGKYTVLFDRRAERRKDVIVNARYGFKQVTNQLLEKITVQYNTDDVRSYRLWYHEGPFFKTLLEASASTTATSSASTRTGLVIMMK